MLEVRLLRVGGRIVYGLTLTLQASWEYPSPLYCLICSILSVFTGGASTTRRWPYSLLDLLARVNPVVNLDFFSFLGGAFATCRRPYSVLDLLAQPHRERGRRRRAAPDIRGQGAHVCIYIYIYIYIYTER